VKAADPADLAAASYDVRLDLLTATGLGAPPAGSAVGASAQQLDPSSGTAFFTYSLGGSDSVEVTVTPPSASMLVAEVSILSFGFAYSGTWYWTPGSPQLGLRSAKLHLRRTPSRAGR